jgi:hypothetical protein
VGGQAELVITLGGVLLLIEGLLDIPSCGSWASSLRWQAGRTVHPESRTGRSNRRASSSLALAHLQPQHKRELEPGVLVGTWPLRKVVPLGLDRSVVQLLMLGRRSGGEVDQFGEDRLSNIGVHVGHRNSVGPVAAADEQRWPRLRCGNDEDG